MHLLLPFLLPHDTRLLAQHILLPLHLLLLLVEEVLDMLERVVQFRRRQVLRQVRRQLQGWFRGRLHRRSQDLFGMTAEGRKRGQSEYLLNCRLWFTFVELLLLRLLLQWRSTGMPNVVDTSWFECQLVSDYVMVETFQKLIVLII